jgi:hypothetical protein
MSIVSSSLKPRDLPRTSRLPLALPIWQAGWQTRPETQDLTPDLTEDLRLASCEALAREIEGKQ